MPAQLATLAAAFARPRRSPAPVTAGFAPAVPPAAAPVTLRDGTRVRQGSQTTCGPTALLMLAATGDPALATWLETGELPAGPRPPEVPADAVDEPDTAARLRAAQEHLHAAVTHRALGPLPWPRSLGTPPWTAARVARFPGVRYRSVPVNDAARQAAHVLAGVHAATMAGVPVPLYTGGDLRQGLAAAVPRHVVLAVPPPADAPHRGRDRAGARVLHLFDPATGVVGQVRASELLGRTEPHRALGGWTHVCWALLPEPVAPRDGGGDTGTDGVGAAHPDPTTKEER